MITIAITGKQLDILIQCIDTEIQKYGFSKEASSLKALLINCRNIQGRITDSETFHNDIIDRNLCDDHSGL